MIYVYDIYIYIKYLYIYINIYIYIYIYIYKVYQIRRKQIGIQMVFQENLATTATATTKTIPAINNNQQSKKWNE